jgi:uncharacterized phiE125 gp8 family phage protein
MAIQVVTAASAKPISVDEAKLFIRVDGNEEDSLIDLLTSMAVERFQLTTGVQLISATLRQTFSSFPFFIQIDKKPITAINSVEYRDENGDWQTFSADNYIVSSDFKLITVKSTVTLPDLYEDEPRPLRITYVAGYGTTAESVPADIRHLILVMCATAYMQRESIYLGNANVTGLQGFFDNYLNKHRIMRITK